MTINIIESVLDEKYTDLKDNIEERIASRMMDKIKDRKSEVIKQINEGKKIT